MVFVKISRRIILLPKLDFFFEAVCINFFEKFEVGRAILFGPEAFFILMFANWEYGREILLWLLEGLKMLFPKIISRRIRQTNDSRPSRGLGKLVP